MFFLTASNNTAALPLICDFKSDFYLWRCDKVFWCNFFVFAPADVTLTVAPVSVRRSFFFFFFLFLSNNKERNQTKNMHIN